jgi:hypothetical protein
VYLCRVVLPPTRELPPVDFLVFPLQNVEGFQAILAHPPPLTAPPHGASPATVCLSEMLRRSDQPLVPSEIKSRIFGTEHKISDPGITDERLSPISSPVTRIVCSTCGHSRRTSAAVSESREKEGNVLTKSSPHLSDPLPPLPPLRNRERDALMWPLLCLLQWRCSPDDTRNWLRGS